jgi:hypothetical protein
MNVRSLVLMTPKGNKGENYIIKTLALRPQRGADQDKFRYIVYTSWEGERERERLYFNVEHRGKRNIRTPDIYSES